MHSYHSYQKIFLGILALFILPLPASAFSDTANHLYKTAITFAEAEKLVNGYSDDTFRPDQGVNRAEFVKIISAVKWPQGLPNVETESCFSDVKANDWFAPFVCAVKSEKIIGGYPDGTFRPANPISIVEAAKILVNVFALPLENPHGEWYEPFLETLSTRNALPTSLIGLETPITRGEMVEMIWRIKTNRNEEASLTAEELMHPTCLRFQETPIKGVDMEKVRAAWLGWINAARSAAGLAPYTYNPQLSRTAFLWSEFSAARNQGSHKRPGQTAYYDYNIITQWFRDLGLTFANVHRVTYSENIGWWPYRCNEDDCTDEMIATIRHTFDGYMAEKGKSYTAHYDSVMNGYFQEIGMGIALSAQGNSYITTHYATAITSDPLPICGANEQ